jgi:hypothetical protein
MKTLRLKINGEDKVFRLADMDNKFVADMLAWARPRLSDPVEDIKPLLSGLSQRNQEIMIKEAMQARRMPKGVDHPEVQALMTTAEGLEFVMLLHFQRHQPDLTKEQIWALHFEAVKQLGDNYVENLPNES